MRKSASEIDAILSATMIQAYLHQYPDASHVRELPTLLRFFTAVCELVGNSNPRMGIGLTATKKQITEHVKSKTGKYHDREVSALIAAVTGEQGYDAQRHKTWRYEHRAFLGEHLARSKR